MKRFLNIIITLIVGAIIYYFTLPAINLHNMGFYTFIAAVAIIFAILETFNKDSIKLLSSKKRAKVQLNLIQLPKFLTMTITACLVVFIGIGIVNLICSPLFNAKSYQTRITVNENGDFKKDIPEVNFNQLPLLDKKSSQVLGDRVMGQMSDLVSQFNVSSLYTQINYNDAILRVTPLEYADEIKWFTTINCWYFEI